MNLLDKSIELISLYDLYQDLLTQKQKDYFEDYYYEDYTLHEISENFGVSRNAVHDQLKRTVNKLYDLESKLHLKELHEKRQKILNKMRDINKHKDIEDLINELEKVE